MAERGKKHWDDRLEAFVYVITLSMLHLIICLPIFTFGPATTALYRTLADLKRGERISYCDYLRDIKKDFGGNMLIGFVILFSAFLVFFLFRHCRTTGGFSWPMYLSGVLISAMMLLITPWIFAVRSYFTVSWIYSLVWSYYLSFIYLGKTLLILFIALAFYMAAIKFMIFLPVVTGIIVYFSIGLQEKVMVNYHRDTLQQIKKESSNGMV